MTRPIRYCKNCVEPDSRPGQVFTAEGLCTPCSIVLRKKEIDWAARRAELRDIALWAKAHRRNGYDCVIGVSGGKDSTRLAMFARDIGMNPLLVCCTYPPKQLTERGAANLANLIELGFDTITVNIAPNLYRDMMRIGFEKFGNWCKPTELALYSSVPRVAIDWGIPLACVGENPFLTFGTGSGSTDGNAENLITMNTLGGGDLMPYLEEGIAPDLLHWYRFPSPDEIRRSGLRLIFLGYFMEDFHDLVNARFAIENGLEVREGADADPERTGSIYNFVALDDDFVFVNQFLKHLKLGFGNVTQQVSSRVRDGTMTREEALELTRRYDGKVDVAYIREFAEFLGLSEEEFWIVAEKFRNPDLWERVGNEGWKLRYPPQ